jgi:outer membrane protein
MARCSQLSSPDPRSTINSNMTHACSIPDSVRVSIVSVATAFAALASISLPAVAQDGVAPASWAIGAGGSTINRPYRGIDDKKIGLPLASYENQWFSIGLPTADWKALKAGPVSIRLRARYAFDGYDAGDSLFFQGMADRKDSVWVGVAALWQGDLLNVSAEALGDVQGHSDGKRARLVADHRFLVGAIGITPRAGVEWVDSHYVRYYYGVKASEAREGRPGYEGDAAANALVGVRLDYSPAPRHNVFIDAGHTRFGSGIKDSPLVDKSGQTTVSLGYLYRF